MNKQLRLINPLLKISNNSFIDLPTPSNISMWWNFGSLLGVCLMMQIMTGLFLTMHYSANILVAFDSIINVSRDVNYGWLIRASHANGASLFFFCMYSHIGRGMYYNSFIQSKTWTVGIILMLLIMGTAFMGYVLPWGQMSFWGATVITNLLSTAPLIGKNLVEWVWGGFAVDGPTLTRFLSLHFLGPFIIIPLSMIHLMFIHQNGSTNPLGTNSNIDMIPFHPYFSFKDLVGLSLISGFLMPLILIYPFLLNDPENFVPASPLITPVHIQPEWYFLFAYAILRSIPNKLGGVIALVLSVLILFILPFYYFNMFAGNQFYPLNQMMYWMFIANFFLLTWIGTQPIEMPFSKTGQLLTFIYFLYFTMNPLINKTWDQMIN